jgi:hypothetical protein
MTAVLKRSDYDDAVELELSRWPGVTFHREVRGKHYALVLAYRGATRFVIYPASPSDSRRGALNHLANVRAELRALGAQRLATTKVEDRRKRKPQPTATVYEFERANPGEGPLRDPFAVLADMRVEWIQPANDVPPESAAPRQSLWSRIAAFVRRVAG